MQKGEGGAQKAILALGRRTLRDPHALKNASGETQMFTQTHADTNDVLLQGR